MNANESVERVRWDGRKWPDRTHWQFSMDQLGEDQHGVWFHVPAGTPARRGREPHRLEVGFVLLVSEGRWWTAEFYGSHPWHDVYVNIGTPCERRASSVRQVDLDLDVVRTNDGRVLVLDEDEFAEHQVRFGYPPELILAAQTAADEVVRLVTERCEPFNLAARPWLEGVDELHSTA